MKIQVDHGIDQLSSNSPTSADFRVIKFVAENVLNVILKFWAQSGAALLTFILFFWIYGGLIAFAFVCFAVTGLLYHAADQLVYHPSQPHHSRIFVPSPKMLGLIFENITITTSDGVKINCVLIKRPNSCENSPLPTIVYFHGNAGNIGHRLSNAKGLYENLKCNILLVEYRGYGHSEGSPSEKGMYLDAKAALKFLSHRKDLDSEKIIVFGRSLGGAVAIDLACDEELSSLIYCVIVENTFTCIPEVAFSMFGWKVLTKIPIWCYKNKFNSMKKITKMSVPVLFISGLADALIPPIMMRQLYDACSSNTKHILTFKTGSHNETWQCFNYYKSIKGFLDKVDAESHIPRQSEVIHNDVRLSLSHVHNV